MFSEGGCSLIRTFSPGATKEPANPSTDSKLKKRLKNLFYRGIMSIFAPDLTDTKLLAGRVSQKLNYEQRQDNVTKPPGERSNNFQKRRIGV